MLGAKLFVAFHLDLRHDFETGFKVQALAVVHMQIGDARLRDGDQAETLGFLAEEFGHKRIDNIVLDLLLEALPHNRRRYMAAAESRNAGKLLILLNENIGFARNFLGGNLNFNFALRALDSFGWTHWIPF